MSDMREWPGDRQLLKQLVRFLRPEGGGAAPRARVEQLLHTVAQAIVDTDDGPGIDVELGELGMWWIAVQLEPADGYACPAHEPLGDDRCERCRHELDETAPPPVGDER